MKPRTFFYFLREALRGLVRNRVMTLTALGIITIGLFLFGLFFLLTANLHHLTVLAWDEIEIRVFLEPTVKNPEKIGAELAALPGVKSVKYDSKAEGAASLEKMLGNQNLFLEGKTPYRRLLTSPCWKRRTSRVWYVWHRPSPVWKKSFSSKTLCGFLKSQSA